MATGSKRSSGSVISIKLRRSGRAHLARCIGLSTGTLRQARPNYTLWRSWTWSWTTWLIRASRWLPYVRLNIWAHCAMKTSFPSNRSSTRNLISKTNSEGAISYSLTTWLSIWLRSPTSKWSSVFHKSNASWSSSSAASFSYMRTRISLIGISKGQTFYYQDLARSKSRTSVLLGWYTQVKCTSILQR